MRFKTPESAAACVKVNSSLYLIDLQVMNGRFFAGRKVIAYVYDGSEKFMKSSSFEEGEDERLERFSKWIEKDD